MNKRVKTGVERDVGAKRTGENGFVGGENEVNLEACLPTSGEPYKYGTLFGKIVDSMKGAYRDNKR